MAGVVTKLLSKSSSVKQCLRGFHVENLVIRKNPIAVSFVRKDVPLFLRSEICRPVISKRFVVEARNAAEEELMPKTLFHQKADHTLEHLAEKIEHELEDHIDDLDVTFSDGILTANLGKFGTYVLNKQTPNRQIWFSSPISGPRRYNFNAKDNTWVNTRDGHELLRSLGEEMTRLTGVTLNFVQ